MVGRDIGVSVSIAIGLTRERAGMAPYVAGSCEPVYAAPGTHVYLLHLQYFQLRAALHFLVASKLRFRASPGYVSSRSMRKGESLTGGLFALVAPDRKGTTEDTIRRAERKGIPITIL